MIRPDRSLTGFSARYLVSLGILCAFGITYLLVPIGHILGDGEPLIGVVLSLLTSLFVGAPLLGGVYWLVRYGYDADQVTRVTAWSLLATVALFILIQFVIAYQGSHDVAIVDAEYVVLHVTAYGTAGGYVTGAYDVHRRAGQKRYRESMRRFGALFEAGPLAFVAVDTDGVVTDWNSTASNLFGWSADEVVGRQLPLVPPAREDEFWSNLEYTNEGNTLDGFETVRARSDGSTVDVTIWSAPIKDDDNAIIGTMVAYADTTDRRLNRQQIEVLNRILRHNLRTGVNTIQGYADLIEESDIDSFAEYATEIKRTAAELQELSEKSHRTRQVLDFRDTAPWYTEVFDVIETERRKVSSAHPTARIDVTGPKGVAVKTNGSVRFVFFELIENAAKHANRVNPVVDVLIEPDRDREMVAVTVRDNGPGLPDAERSVLRGHQETPLNHGSGLGLWTVYWAVESLGGDIDVEVSDSSGTAITITLPAQFDAA